MSRSSKPALVRANRLHRSSFVERADAPEEVFNMAVYAVSPQAFATKGAARSVDGGIIDSITGFQGE